MSTDSTSPRGRGRPRDAELELRILEAARELVASAGIAGASASAIAARAGTGKPSLYLRFTNAEAVVDAALERLEASRTTMGLAVAAAGLLAELEEREDGGAFLSGLLASAQHRAAILERWDRLTAGEELEGSELAAAAEREALEHRELG